MKGVNLVARLVPVEHANIVQREPISLRATRAHIAFEGSRVTKRVGINLTEQLHLVAWVAKNTSYTKCHSG